MSRYETFVIRLWIEDESGLDHGEVSHLTTGTGLRFLQIEQALQFIQKKVAQEPRSDNPSDGVERSLDRLLIDFRSPSKD